MIRAIPFVILAFITAQGVKPGCHSERPVPVDRWRGEYFDNQSLSGTPVIVRDDGAGDLRFDWRLQSPAPECGLKPDRFSVRWTRKVVFASGVFRFRLKADDGVRFSIDGKKWIDDWNDRSATVRTADVTLDPGNHLVSLEYYENFGSALVDLSWQRHPCFDDVPPEHWKAEFHEGARFGPAPVAVRDEGAGPLYFSRLSGNCLSDDKDYAVRWSRRTLFNSGRYSFSLRSDGPAKLLVDDKTIIDRPAATGGSSAELTLKPGNHTVILEYLKKRGAGGVKLDWRWID